MDTLKSTSYRDPQINPSLEPSILEVYLDWGLALRNLDRSQFYSVSYRSLDQLQGLFRPYFTEMLRTKVCRRYNLASSKNRPSFSSKSQNLNASREFVFLVFQKYKNLGET